GGPGRGRLRDSDAPPPVHVGRRDRRGAGPLVEPPRVGEEAEGGRRQGPVPPDGSACRCRPSNDRPRPRSDRPIAEPVKAPVDGAARLGSGWQTSRGSPPLLPLWSLITEGQTL